MISTQMRTADAFPKTLGPRGPVFYETAPLNINVHLRRDAIREMLRDGLVIEQIGPPHHGRATFEGAQAAKDRWERVIRFHKKHLVWELAARDGTRFDLLRAVIESRHSMRNLISENPRAYPKMARDRAIFDWMACYEPGGLTGKQPAAEWGQRRSQWLGQLLDAERWGWMTVKRAPGVPLQLDHIERGRAVWIPTEATSARIVTARQLWA